MLKINSESKKAIKKKNPITYSALEHTDAKKNFHQEPISTRIFVQYLEYQVGVLTSLLQGGTACWQSPSAEQCDSYTLYLCLQITELLAHSS